jgi:hypothetical protein
MLATTTVAALNACGSARGAQSPPDVNQPSTPSAAATSGARSGTISMSIAPSPNPFPGCPVTAGVLLAALKADGVLYPRSGRPDLLGTVDCYKGFATAIPSVNGQPLGGRVLFGNDGTSWRPLNTGSADFCRGYVPPDIAAHFDGCR